MQQVAENGCSTSGGQSRVRALLDSYLWALDQSLGLAIVLVNRLLLSVSSECKSFFSVVVTLGLTTVGEHHLSNVSRESIDVSRDMRQKGGWFLFKLPLLLFYRSPVLSSSSLHLYFDLSLFLASRFLFFFKLNYENAFQSFFPSLYVGRERVFLIRNMQIDFRMLALS